MMHHVWTKIVVAGLIILGEGAFASESSEFGDDWYEADRNIAQLSQSLVQNADESMWQPPPLACVDATRIQTGTACQTFAAASVLLLNQLRYHSFSPRAPPVPAP